MMNDSIKMVITTGFACLIVFALAAAFVHWYLWAERKRRDSKKRMVVDKLLRKFKY